jgi:hypothetical protein
MLGFPNLIDSAAVSGGSWMSSLPLSNVKDRVLGRVARSADDSIASACMVINLNKACKIRALAAINHNLSVNAKFRVRASLNALAVGYADADWQAQDYDSGWQDVWPVVYASNSQEWEDDNWWTGKYTTDEMAGYTPSLIHLLPADILVQVVRLEFNDTLNPAGYVQVGRVFAGPVWQPSINMGTGASLGWETDTDGQKAIGGAEYFQRRTPYRVASFVINYLSVDEAFGRAFEMQRQAGVDREILFIHDPDDTLHALRRRFLGRLRELSAIEYPYSLYNSAAFKVKEIL